MSLNSDKMYKMKRIDNFTVIDLPTCMYRMRPVGIVELEPTENDTHELEDLLKRQENVNLRLENLKKKMDLLIEKFSGSTKSNTNETVKELPKCTGNVEEVVSSKAETFAPIELQNLVIRANPSSPPLSLFVLKSYFESRHNVFCFSHVHSSVKEIAEELKYKFNSVNASRKDCKSSITLIWTKSEGTPSLVADEGLIVGEYAIARYLWRLLAPNHEFADVDRAAQVDDLLDLASSFKFSGNPSTKAVLSTLDKKLSKSAWLVGSDLSLADIILCSLLHSDKKTFGKLSKNVDKWYHACLALPQFKGL